MNEAARGDFSSAVANLSVAELPSLNICILDDRKEDQYSSCKLYLYLKRVIVRVCIQRIAEVILCKERRDTHILRYSCSRG